MVLQAMIVCILFFSMDLSTSLWTGIIVGMGESNETAYSRVIYVHDLSTAPVVAHVAVSWTAYILWPCVF